MNKHLKCTHVRSRTLMKYVAKPKAGTRAMKCRLYTLARRAIDVNS